MLNWFQSTQTSLSSYWDRANRQNAYWPHLVRAIQNFSNFGLSEAASFSYWALLSLFPLVVLGILLATQMVGIRSARPELTSIINEFIPTSVSTIVSDSFATVNAHRSSYSLISIVSLIFSATRLFSELQRSLSRIFRDQKTRAWPRRIVMGLVMIIVFVALLTISVNLSGMLTTSALRARNGAKTFGVDDGIVLFFTIATLFFMLYRFIPRRKINWLILIVTSLLASAGYEINRLVFDWYLNNIANFGIVYGSVGAVVGLLTWLFFLACIISFCAEMAVATDDWLQQRSVAETIVEAKAVASSEIEIPAEIEVSTEIEAPNN